MDYQEKENRTYLSACSAYKELVGPNPNLRINFEKDINFIIAILIPLVTLGISIVAMKMRAPKYIIRGSAFFGIVVAIFFLYICALILSQIQMQCEENKLSNSNQFMNKLTISFIISLAVVILQCMFLIYT